MESIVAPIKGLLDMKFRQVKQSNPALSEIRNTRLRSLLSFNNVESTYAYRS